MLKKDSGLYSVMLIAALIFSVCGAVFLALAVLFGYDTDIGHFSQDNSWNTIAAVCFSLGVLTAVICGVVLRGKFELGGEKSSYFVKFFGALAAVLLAACFIMSFISGDFEKSDVLGRVAALFTLLAAPYLLMIAFGLNREFYGAILALITAVKFIVSLMQVYFSSYYAINAPIKSYLLVLYCAAILYFCAETRISLGRNSFSAIAVFTMLEVVCGAVAPAFLVCNLLSFEIVLADILTSSLMTAVWLLSVCRGFSFAAMIVRRGSSPDLDERSDDPAEISDK